MRMLSFDDRTADFIEVFKRSAARTGYALELHGPGQQEPASYTRFKQVYRHLSPNNPSFELASFRRWFELSQHVRRDERVVHADSDLVLFTPWLDMPEEIRSADGIVGSVGVNSGIPERQINVGYSSWTGALLTSFCDYVIASYESRADDLAAIYAEQANYQPYAAISDMALVHLWVAETGVDLVETNRLMTSSKGRAIYIDHNITTAEAQGVRFRQFMGRKAMTFREQNAFFMTVQGEPIAAASIHLAGRNKMLARPIERGDRRSIELGSAYLNCGRLARKALRHLRGK